jgi:hypothetical protein
MESSSKEAPTFLQHAAWFIAIIVGIFTIINYIRIWCQKTKKKPLYTASQPDARILNFTFYF